jgi:transposase
MSGALLDRNAEIVRLYREGYRVCDLAVQFGVSEQRICQLLRRKGVPRKNGGRRRWVALPSPTEQER